jgi:SAM-dependent methyltransferase
MAPGCDADPTQRFCTRAGDYARYRPGYPPRILNILRDATGLTSEAAIADVGSGTGISTSLFLENGNLVYAVEPNLDMRTVAESLLGRHDRFVSVEGRAEATELPGRSVDYVVAAQAFHWFDRQAAHQEFRRILRPGGWVVLLWNRLLLDRTPFLIAYEALLREFGTDYEAVRRYRIDPAVFGAFFEGEYTVERLENAQVLDLRGVRGRLLSSSFTPGPDNPRREPMLEELRRIFREYNEAGYVRLEYRVELVCGQLEPATVGANA